MIKHIDKIKTIKIYYVNIGDQYHKSYTKLSPNILCHAHKTRISFKYLYFMLIFV